MFKRRVPPLQNFPYTLSAPTRGIDGLSPLMQMREAFCVDCENFFPATDGLETRDGYVLSTTGFAKRVKSLHVYAATSGVDTLYAATDDGVFDASSPGAVGAAEIALTNGACISTQISTGAGNYLFLVNGTDDLVTFDGTTWATVASFGSISTNTLSYVELYRQRMFFAVKNSLDLVYLAPNAISGSHTDYPLGAIFKQGGFIIALATWTIDGGSGPEDKFVVITNKGQAAVFVGSDPATWSFQGVYNIGRPLGAKCVTKWGGDLLVITESGLMPMSTALQSADVARTETITQRIRPQIVALAKLYSSEFGWDILVNPLEPWVLVSIPSVVPFQYIMNLQTGAWSRWSGIYANCWARVGDEVYFGSTTSVNRLTGVSDAGANITAFFLQAYSGLGYSRQSQVKLVKPYFKATAAFTYDIGIAPDLVDPREFTQISTAVTPLTSLWGTAVWGASFWSGADISVQDWQTVPDQYSNWKGLYLRIVSNSTKVRYYGSDLLYTRGSNF